MELLSIIILILTFPLLFKKEEELDKIFIKLLDEKKFYSSINVSLDMEEIKDTIAQLNDDDDIFLEAIASKYKIPVEEFLKKFDVKNLRGLKKKFGLPVESYNLFDKIADKFSKKPPILDYGEEMSLIKSEYIKIDRDELYNLMFAGLFVLNYKQFSQYSKLGLTLHWLAYKNDAEKFNLIKKYYVPELGEDELPDEFLKENIKYVPSIDGSKEWFKDHKERFKKLSNPTNQKILIETIGNMYKEWGVTVDTNYNTLKDFVDKELSKIKDI